MKFPEGGGSVDLAPELHAPVPRKDGDAAQCSPSLLNTLEFSTALCSRVTDHKLTVFLRHK